MFFYLFFVVVFIVNFVVFCCFFSLLLLFYEFSGYLVCFTVNHIESQYIFFQFFILCFLLFVAVKSARQKLTNQMNLD